MCEQNVCYSSPSYFDMYSKLAIVVLSALCGIQVVFGQFGFNAGMHAWRPGERPVFGDSSPVIPNRPNDGSPIYTPNSQSGSGMPPPTPSIAVPGINIGYPLLPLDVSHLTPITGPATLEHPNSPPYHPSSNSPAFAPPSHQMYPPSGQQAYAPTSQQFYPPSSQQVYPPPSQQVYPPSSQQVYPPTNQQVYAPPNQGMNQGYNPQQGNGYPSRPNYVGEPQTGEVPSSPLGFVGRTANRVTGLFRNAASAARDTVADAVRSASQIGRRLMNPGESRAAQSPALRRSLPSPPIPVDAQQAPHESDDAETHMPGMYGLHPLRFG